MDSSAGDAAIELPPLPASHADFIPYLEDNKDKPMIQLLEPYKQYDNEMRKVFAQQPGHPSAKEPSIVPIYNGHEGDMTIRARDLASESEETKATFIMPLSDDQRSPNGYLAIVPSLSAFRTNFNVFSESALVDLDWSNVVAAGSAVVTSLLAVPEENDGTKRALREYYHETVAPASDVDLFLYGLDEEQAKAKIKQIESSIRDAILTETTTIRTKNAVTIVSQYPTRHVQVVLRVYKTISEILTGFDVDCSCAAYDGKQVYASPRAIAAFMTQTNTIDLSRRSPSYESRLSKYAHRGFEIFWPDLDRSRVDPTIFERSFGRTEGLARLLILEKLPNSEDRDAYLDQRRAERGRPAINRWRMNSRQLRGNIKDDHEDEIPDWVNAEDVSDYHTFTIPYGPKFHARKIEKLLFTKDMLLNAEWNLPKDREVHLHRHPAFFGRAEDVFHDCCGTCPQPKTVEEEEVFEEENKIYVSGDIAFIKDDPGRQTIGSFHPITPAGWTEMAYVGNTARLCQAVVESNVEYVRTWLEQDGNDPNTRDYTGRTPLHLAVTDSSPEVVQALIDHDARLVARLVDGRTALHLAAIRGSVEIISALLRRSEANEQMEQEKTDARRAARGGAKEDGSETKLVDDASTKEHEKSHESEADNDADSDIDMVDCSDEESVDATTETSMVKIKPPVPEADDKALEGDADSDEPDVYDINVLAWDSPVSPLHLAIVNGHIDAVRCLVQDFGADVLLPVKLFHEHDKSAKSAILTLVLALQLPIAKAEEMTQTLIKLGASCAQADLDQNTTLQYATVEQPGLLPLLDEADHTGVARAVNHLSVSGYTWNPEISSSLMTAITSRDSLAALCLLGLGAKPEIDFSAYIKAYQTKNEASTDSNHNRQQFQRSVEQPVVCAVQCELPNIARKLIEEHGVDINTLTKTGWTVVNDEYSRNYNNGNTLLDQVREKIAALSTWKQEEVDVSQAPIPLQPDETYISGLTPNSYAWRSAQKQVEDAKEKYSRDLKVFQQNSQQVTNKDGLPEKQAAIEALLKQFQALEETLVAKGAKTFKELYTDIEKAREHNRHGYTHNMREPTEFKVEFNFRLPDLTDEAHSRYMRLFEAAWIGDQKTVKELTLLPWKSADGEDKPPLQVAVMDRINLSPFAIAVLRGHLDLATLVMEIAQAQYVPPEAPKRERHRLAGAEDEDESDSDSDLQIISELVDEVFTVETVGQVSTQTKSRVKPINMLRWAAPPVDLFLDGRSHSSSKSSARLPDSLLEYAIRIGDDGLLDYLISLREKYIRLMPSSTEDAEKFFEIPSYVYEYAIALDLPHSLSKLMKRSGAGIPMENLVKQSGIEDKEKPKYYQGLSVYGKKRTDWAVRGSRYRRNYSDLADLSSTRPPLLQAAYNGSLETVEWLLSEAPIRCYNDFAKANSEDKRIKCLARAPGGFEKCVRRFLGRRSHLIMHCCIEGSPTSQSAALLRYLVKTFPEYIEARSKDLLTPLHVAFSFRQVEAAKILIAAGADQTARDKASNNIVHHLLHLPVTSEKALKDVSAMLDLIDKRLLPNLFLEKSAYSPGSLTPLAHFIHECKQSPYYGHRTLPIFKEKIIHLILKHSAGAELNSINGEGHTLLHVAVRENDEVLVKAILERDPTLLMRENATGRTPFEMAEDKAIRIMVSGPPSLNLAHCMDPMMRARVQGVCDRPPSEFVIEGERDERTPRERIWELLRESKAKLQGEGRAKRRLVTLNEANEVARRLAGGNRGELRSLKRVFDEVEGEEDLGLELEAEDGEMEREGNTRGEEGTARGKVRMGLVPVGWDGGTRIRKVMAIE